VSGVVALRCLNLGGQFGGGGGRHNRGGARILVASPWGYGLCEELIGRLRLVFGECIWKAYYVQYYGQSLQLGAGVDPLVLRLLVRLRLNQPAERYEGTVPCIATSTSTVSDPFISSD
jgi:hypothetical protein